MKEMKKILQGRPIIPGKAGGFALVSSEPVSFWGGYDYETGTIIDQRHPLAGECAAGRVLAVPFTRGSSTTTAVLLEAVKAGTAPAAILTTAPDSFFALAAIVADEMYAKPIPLIVLSDEDFAQLQSRQKISVTEAGQVEVSAENLIEP
jgi:predicted aconitase with swiveling domain